jgi:V8-like Glu-specific endopeptidase/chitinase
VLASLVDELTFCADSNETKLTDFADYQQMPYYAIGKVFFSVGGSDYVCSASIGQPNNFVWTAGHCCYHSETKQFVEQFTFVPQYFAGTAPLGTYYAVAVHVPATYLMEDRVEVDYGIAIFEQALPAEFGSFSLIVDLDPANTTYIAYGYPAAAPFDGEYINQCESLGCIRDPNPSPETVGMDCNSTGGSSGGPWLVHNNTQIGGVVSYGITDQPGIQFSPYFDNETVGFYEEVLVQESQTPFPSPSVISPTPTAEPPTPTTGPTPTAGPPIPPPVSPPPPISPTSQPPAVPPSMPSPAKIIYIDWRAIDWNAPQNNVIQAVDAGYNIIILAFYLLDTPADIAQAWQGISQSDQQAAVNYAHSKGAQVMVAAGGSTVSPYSQISGSDYGQRVAQWALQNNLDGVDFDMENFDTGLVAPGLSASDTIQWLVDASNAARSVLGSDRLISHAPQAPYFGVIGGNQWAGSLGGYTGVYQMASSSIDFFNCQFYNQGSCYTSYDSLFIDSACSFAGTSVKQIADMGIPLSKIVVGKPVTSSDAGSGYVDADSLAAWVSQAGSDIGWSSGVMGWVWAGPETGAWINTIYS